MHVHIHTHFMPSSPIGNEWSKYKLDSSRRQGTPPSHPEFSSKHLEIPDRPLFFLHYTEQILITFILLCSSYYTTLFLPLFLLLLLTSFYLSYVIALKQCFSQCSPHTTSISIMWGPIRHANLGAHAIYAVSETGDTGQIHFSQIIVIPQGTHHRILFSL